MVKPLILAALATIPLIMVFSGCTTETGKLVETTELAIPENPSQQDQPTENIEELHKEFEEFEKSSAENQSEPESEANETSSEQLQEEKNETQTKTEPKCPNSCDDKNPCTDDFCSEDTEYKCKHNPVIPCCGNLECEEGENSTLCPKDCKQAECSLQCGQCEILDNGTCSCLPKECIPNDGCCPENCNYTTDSDCTNPDMCSSDTDCNDSNPCTVDICSGQPKNCSSSPVTECTPDGCCPENCTYQTDSDCQRPSVVFSEIYYNPQGNDEEHEWVEVYNNGTIEVDFTKWRFEESGTQHKINNASSTTLLESNTYAVIVDSTARFLSDYPEYSGLLFDSSFSLSNSGEELILRTVMNGETADSVFYNSTWGANGNGFSLEKIEINGPNTQENWNQSIVEKGTPGQKNSVS